MVQVKCRRSPHQCFSITIPGRLKAVKLTTWDMTMQELGRVKYASPSINDIYEDGTYLYFFPPPPSPFPLTLFSIPPPPPGDGKTI